MRAPYKRIIWVILDAAGYELTRRCLKAGVCPALRTMAREGYLGPTLPSEPNCQTPPALRALVAGTEPRENGIWGYLMPAGPARPGRSVSGFAVPPRGAAPLWEVLEQHGQGYTLVNTVFRKDRAWARRARAYDLLLDGYRHQRRRGGLIALNPGGGRVRLPVPGMSLKLEQDGLRLFQAGRAPEALSPGEVRELRPNRRGGALLQWVGKSDCFVFPSSRVHLRLNPRLRSGIIKVPRSLMHGCLFRYARSREDLPPEQELAIPERVTAQIGDLALQLTGTLPSRLFMIYFSLIDELSHTYLDQIEQSWPAGRGAEIARRSYALLDAYLGRIMEQADERTLVAVSSDHGQAPFRRVLKLNELFFQAGLVRADAGGYDFRRSEAYYHPADCGQVLANPHPTRRAGSEREKLAEKIEHCLQAANSELDARLAWRRGEAADPYLCFVYPEADTHITGKGSPGDDILDCERRGGHHLSAYCPTPWIRSMLALWSPGGLRAAGPQPPQRNKELKSYLLACLGLAEEWG